MNPRLLGEIESPHPLRAAGGVVDLRGWCGGTVAPQEIRLHTASTVLTGTLTTPRPDLAPGARAFTIRSRLPAGVHWAEFQARHTDGEWRTFRQYSLCVEPTGFVGKIESHPTDSILAQRDFVHGWVQAEAGAITQLDLHYGHQTIPCDLGAPRTDVAKPSPPTSPARAFKTRFILGAGRGPLRLSASLADGTRATLRTGLRVAIATDENHGADIDFAAERLELPRPAQPAIPALRHADQTLNICFILHGSFAANSALHVTALANELTAAGHRCVVAVTHDLATVHNLRAPQFQPILHAEARQGLNFADGRGPDIVHAWTTREQVRQLAEALRQRYQAKLVVHLEDNEQAITEATLNRDDIALGALTDDELDRLIPAQLTHPRRGPAFLANADAVTLIMESLGEFAPPAMKRLILWPAADERFFYPRPPPAAFLRMWSRQPGETILFYHGNAHAANAVEMRELYRAVLLLNHRGRPTTLIRAGLDTVDFLGDLAAAVAPHVISLGLVANHRLPDLMALADYFVQPGVDDAFNRYRFPSKLPEFFSLGRPVILPRANLGTYLRDGTDALVLDRADAGNIASAVQRLQADPSLAQQLSVGATAFAQANFSWRRAADKLNLFYTELLARSAP